MAMTIPFFPRQTLVGAGTEITYFSDPFDVSQYASMNVELQVFGLIGTAPTIQAYMETAADLHTADDNWKVTQTFALVTSAPTTISAVHPQGAYNEFARAKVTINADDHAVTLSILGVAREST